ncbi:hypothetical protein DPMN_129912 [Dreissena polymorpha]|uniref:Uncharacterized protein n=1 Tax=Dreissena polymorpha TaxID=45954 RepID=A0A9D4H6M4_DREPO|nr:hypothetical protein DPMN_129912 [Dreissena polymorpha]
MKSLEEQLADSQGHELRTVRELEKLKIDMQTPVSTAEMVRNYNIKSSFDHSKKMKTSVSTA